MVLLAMMIKMMMKPLMMTIIALFACMQMLALPCPMPLVVFSFSGLMVGTLVELQDINSHIPATLGLTEDIQSFWTEGSEVKLLLFEKLR